MAHPQVVITQSNENTPAVGGLFDGVSFFLLQRLPSRSSFIDRIQANGGRVVRQENQADHIIADHYRHDCPAGSISYTFIETAIRTGTLPDPNDHSAGRRQGAAREAGAAAPGKGTRTPFTTEDDRVLWQWVKQSGGMVKGNEIYKQLEAQNSRHTWQAWRDRYVKRLIDRPPAGVEVTVAANPPPSPPTAQDDQEEIAPQVDVAQEEADVQEEEQEVADVEGDFTEDELELLLDQGEDIELIPEDREDEAWSAWAQAYPQHSAQSWQRFWKEEGQPAYQRSKITKEEEEEEEWRTTQGSSEDVPGDVDGADEHRPSRRRTESAEPIPSGLQKRKRPAFVSVAEKGYGKKKRKSHNDEIFGKEDSDDERATATEVAGQTMPISELNRQTGARLEHESQEGAMATDEAMQDAHAEAQAKFDEEVLGVPTKPVPIAAHPMSDWPTSDINRAADQQLRRESLERDEEEEDVDDSSLLQTPSVQSQDEDENEAESVRSQEPENALEAALDAPGDRLTEANLASQQAEHTAQLLRGADLPEDDDVQDSEQQSAYVRYLQNLTVRPEGTHSTPAITFETQKSIAIESQLPPNDSLPAFDAHDAATFEELPHSSQQEIDGMLDDMIQWPESPVNAQRRDAPQPQSQSIHPATQVTYPELPTQSSVHSQRDEGGIFSSQLSMVPEVSYPALRESQAESVLSAQPSISQQQQLADEVSSASSSEESMSSQQVAEEEGDIDLAVAAPFGGWSPSLTKAQSSQATQVARLQQRQAKQERQLSEQSRSPSQAAGTQEVVELSSTSPSSSSSDESEELPADPTRVPAATRRTALETQDILNAETQQPDLSMPLPPQFDDSNTSDRSPLSSPNRLNTIESQRRLADTQRLGDDDVDTYITTMVVRGFKEASVIAALKCTSMRPELVDLVLHSERRWKSIPTDVPGIWSEEEDRVLESGNAKGLRRLEDKHSWKEAEARMKFLEEYREESVDGGDGQ